jgi:3-oxoacyl-[acyl-carrier protein] reductase
MAAPRPVAVPIFADLEGCVAVVTGGSKGIGAATCRALAANGVDVAVVARGLEGADALARDLREAGVSAVGIAADCTSAVELERALAIVEAELGPPDVLVAFAGGFERRTPLLEIGEDEWRDVLDWNLTSTFLTVKTFLPGMVERRRGAIVTMASNAGRYLDITLTASYAAAKAGVVMFTRHAAKEVGQYGVRLNCVAPATILSERVERVLTDEHFADVVSRSPLGTIGLPEDAAYATLFLCSDAARWLTGVTLDIAGGRIML